MIVTGVAWVGLARVTGIDSRLCAAVAAAAAPMAVVRVRGTANDDEQVIWTSNVVVVTAKVGVAATVSLCVRRKP